MKGKYYRHFKGNVYRVLHIAKHSETLEDIVVYQAMYGERGIWVRPKAMFEEVLALRCSYNVGDPAVTVVSIK